MWFKVVDQPFALMVTASTIADKERSCVLFREGRWYGNLSMKSNSKKVFFTKCEAKTYTYFQCWQRMTELKRRYLIFWHFSGQKYKNIFFKVQFKIYSDFFFCVSFHWKSHKAVQFHWRFCARHWNGTVEEQWNHPKNATVASTLDNVDTIFRRIMTLFKIRT